MSYPKVEKLCVTCQYQKNNKCVCHDTYICYETLVDEEQRILVISLKPMDDGKYVSHGIKSGVAYYFYNINEVLATAQKIRLKEE